MVLVIKASRTQLAKLGEVLVAAFKEGLIPSPDEDSFVIEMDDNPAVYCKSNLECLCWEVLNERNQGDSDDDS